MRGHSEWYAMTKSHFLGIIRQGHICEYAHKKFESICY